MSSSAIRSAARRPRARDAAPSPSRDIQPREQDCWLTPTGGATRPVAEHPEPIRTHVAGPNPLRRSLSAPAIATDPLGGTVIPPEVLGQLRRSTGEGQALPDDLAASAGPLLGAEVSGARLHTDGAADQLARSMQSVAFTHGRDIYFSAGSYAPHTAAGSQLLAHELAHVTQRDSGRAGTIGRANDASESAADRAAERIAPALRRSLLGGSTFGPATRGGMRAGSEPTVSAPVRDSGGGALQRTMLRRRLSASSADISANRGKKKGLAKLTGGRDSLDKIGVLLDQHAALTDQQAQVTSLTAIIVLVDRWLKAHTGQKDRSMVMLLEDVKAEARRDLGQAVAQQRYVNDMRAGQEVAKHGKPLEYEATNTPFAEQLAVSVPSKAHGIMAAQGLQLNDLHPGKAVQEVVRAANLTEAEVAAIKLFTAQDFLYINPAVANSRSWMDAQMGDIATAAKAKKQAGALDPRMLGQEGGTHAGVMMQGLAKMEPKIGKVYRGARMSEQEFEDTYGKRTQLTYNSFVSSAVEPGPAEGYANGGSAQATRADQTVSVLCILEVNDARDIQALSEFAQEKEWLLLPGATFAITKIEDKANGAPGRFVPATSWKVVHLKQIKAGSINPEDAAPSAGTANELSGPAAQALTRLGRRDFSAPAPGESAAQKMQRLGRGDFSTASTRRRRP